MPFPISTERQFGFVIAYLIPGFLVLSGIGQVSQPVSNWLSISKCAPTIGGFLYSVLASLLAGLFCSTARWLVIDSIHARLGIKPEKWQMEQLAKNFEAFEIIVAYHYRYYQFYGNMVVAIPICLAFFLLESEQGQFSIYNLCAVLFVEVIFFWGSIDSFKKYVTRSNELLESKLRIIL